MAGVKVMPGVVFVPGGQGPGGTLAVDEELPTKMVFFLGDIVGHIVEEPDLIGLPPAQNLGHGLDHIGRHQLPVGKGEVDGTGHGGQVAPSQIRLDGGTGQPPVGQFDAKLGGLLGHFPGIVLADLVAEAPAAGMDR